MTDIVRVSREAVEAIADDLRAISLELTKKRATTPVSEDIFRKALALEAMLAASPQEAVPTKREAALADLAKLDGETMDLAASPQGEGGWITHDGGPNPVPGKMVEGQYPGETRVFHGPSEGVVWGRGVIYRVTEGVKP